MYYANKRGGIHMEYIRKCNICGNIWCYTDKDIKKSRNNGITALLSSVGSLANTVGGTMYNAYEQNKMADRSLDKLIDYGQCPKCNSSDTIMITKEEYEQIKKVEEKKKIGYFINTPENEIIKKVEVFIEDEKWMSAKLYLEQLKDIDSKDPKIYLLSLYVENKALNDDELIKNCSNANRELTESENFQYIKKYGSEECRRKIEELNSKILKNIDEKSEKERQEKYNSIVNIAFNSINKTELEKAKRMLIDLEEIDDSKNALKIIDEKLERIKKIRTNFIKRFFKISIITFIVIAVIVMIANFVITLVKKENLYDEALMYYEKEDYNKSIEILESIPNYKDSNEKKAEAKELLKNKNEEEEEKANQEKYKEATDLLENGEAFEAYKKFSELKNYSNSEDMAKESLIQNRIEKVSLPIEEVVENEFNNYEIIKDNDRIKKILIGNWCYTEQIGRVAITYKRLMSINDDGTLNMIDSRNDMVWYWQVSDGYFYWEGKSTSPNVIHKSPIDPIKYGIKFEVCRLADDVYVLKNVDSRVSDKVLFPEDSKWAKRLEIYMNNRE